MRGVQHTLSMEQIDEIALSFGKAIFRLIRVASLLQQLAINDMLILALFSTICIHYHINLNTQT